MYIQITTRCNMTCAHCCYSCTKQGEDMDKATFRAALALYGEEVSFSLAIGGGEPTLHKQFMPWLFEAICAQTMSFHEEMPVFVATNGTNTKVALALAGLASKGVIYGCLSLTEWHRDQNVVPTPEVIKAFRIEHIPTTERYYNEDLREIRGEEHYEPYAVGRATDITDKTGCCCDDLVVAPDGSIFACGCKLEQFGSVHAPMIPQEYFERDEKCSQEYLGSSEEYINSSEDEE